MRKGYIYYLKCPEKNCPRYIGQTVSPKYRLNKHLKGKFDKNNHYCNWLKHLKNLNLLDKVQMIIIEENELVDIFSWMDERETFWIKEMKSLGFDLTNASEGGQGCKGYKHTQAAKDKIKKTGQQRTGYKASDSHKLSISKSLKGNQRRKGKHFTDEQRKKISIGRSGIPAWNAGKKMKYSDEQLNKQKEGIKLYFKEKRKSSIEKFKKILIDKNLLSTSEFSEKYGKNSSNLKTRLRYYLKHYRNELERTS